MWLKIRVVLILFVFLGGLATTKQGVYDLPTAPGWMLGMMVAMEVLSCLLLPLLLLLVAGVQAKSSLTGKRWTQPTHRDNPFLLANPLSFFHFFGFTVIGGGAGSLISSLWLGPFVAVQSLVVCFGGAMILVGVRLSMRVYNSKLTDTDT